jgi:hypothetical protein
VADATYTIPHTADFALTGDGSAAAWSKAPWTAMTRVGGTADWATKCKLLWSDTGIYVLVDGQDSLLNCTHQEDGADLFLEDVVEIFLWPDEAHPFYLEYEQSLLNKELNILVGNRQGSFFGWKAWKTESGERASRRAVAIRGGPQRPGATITGWSTECFLPFAWMRCFAEVPPKAGTRWRGNVYRIDYRPETTHWALAPATGTNFHAYQQFGTLAFGG